MSNMTVGAMAVRVSVVSLLISLLVLLAPHNVPTAHGRSPLSVLLRGSEEVQVQELSAGAARFLQVGSCSGEYPFIQLVSANDDGTATVRLRQSLLVYDDKQRRNLLVL
jgi:hypothetical protein